MDIKNMEVLPLETRADVGGFIEDISGVYGEDIVSIFAYGSITSADYSPKTSDINIAVVLNDVSIHNLSSSLKIIKKGLKKRINAPLFLTKDYISRSMDTFPMEFLSMKASGCILFGEDVLSPLEADDEDLRRECEYQIKGKILTMRQAYLEQGLSRKGMEKLVKASLRALLPVFRGILMIGHGNKAPQGKIDTVKEMGERFGLDVSLLLEALSDTKNDGRIGSYDAGDFLQELISQMEKLSDIVDGL